MSFNVIVDSCCDLTPEELHALLDHMNLSALTHYQP